MHRNSQLAQAMAVLHEPGTRPVRTFAEAREAYRRRILALHPDRGGPGGPALQAVLEAWQVVKAWEGRWPTVVPAAPVRLRLGEVLVRLGTVPGPAVADALVTQRRSGVRFGEAAVGRGWLSSDEVGRLLLVCRPGERMGEAAVRTKLLRQGQVQSLLELQSTGRLRLGEILVARGALTPADLEMAVEAQRRRAGVWTEGSEQS